MYFIGALGGFTALTSLVVAYRNKIKNALAVDPLNIAALKAIFEGDCKTLSSLLKDRRISFLRTPAQYISLCHATALIGTPNVIKIILNAIGQRSIIEADAALNQYDEVALDDNNLLEDSFPGKFLLSKSESPFEDACQHLNIKCAIEFLKAGASLVIRRPYLCVDEAPNTDCLRFSNVAAQQELLRYLAYHNPPYRPLSDRHLRNVLSPLLDRDCSSIVLDYAEQSAQSQIWYAMHYAPPISPRLNPPAIALAARKDNASLFKLFLKAGGDLTCPLDGLVKDRSISLKDYAEEFADDEHLTPEIRKIIKEAANPESEET